MDVTAATVLSLDEVLMSLFILVLVLLLLDAHAFHLRVAKNLFNKGIRLSVVEFNRKYMKLGSALDNYWILALYK